MRACSDTPRYPATTKKTNNARRDAAMTRRLSQWTLQKAQIHIVLFIFLVILTLNILRPQSPCQKLRTAHETLIRENTPRCTMRFLRMAYEIPASRCTASHLSRSKSYQIEGRYAQDALQSVLDYITTVTGAYQKIFVEICSRHTDSSAQLFVNAGWDVISLQESWTRYELVRKRHEYPPHRAQETRVEVIDAQNVTVKRLNTLVKHVGMAGVVDVMTVFAADGRDIEIISAIRECILRPRILVIAYREYWGAKYDRIRIGEGGAMSLFAGGSIRAFIRILNASNFRLVHCIGSMPVAIFVDASTGVGDGVLRTVTRKRCIAKREDIGVRWRRDAEAMWDVAQQQKWM